MGMHVLVSQIAAHLKQMRQFDARVGQESSCEEYDWTHGDGDGDGDGDGGSNDSNKSNGNRKSDVIDRSDGNARSNSNGSSNGNARSNGNGSNNGRVIRLAVFWRCICISIGSVSEQR